MIVVSVFGKSSYVANSCKADVIDKLLRYSIFRKTMLDDPEINENILVSWKFTATILHITFYVVIFILLQFFPFFLQGNIEGFYDKSQNVIYLHLLGSFDTHSLLKIYDQYSVQLEEKVSYCEMCNHP